jgi:hypothetical protein
MLQTADTDLTENTATALPIDSIPCDGGAAIRLAQQGRVHIEFDQRTIYDPTILNEFRRMASSMTALKEAARASDAPPHAWRFSVQKQQADAIIVASSL